MKKLLQSLKPSFLLFAFLVIVLAIKPVVSVAQTTGDVAFTGFNGEGSDSDDGFAVVLFTNYVSGDQIHFSSMEWNGSAFAGSGGDFTWEATSNVSAGTVLVFTDVEGTPSVNTGLITDDADMNLSGSGDVIYAYLGTDKDSPSTPFLGAIATDANLYNQPDGTEGTLANTGLTQAGNETILLPDNIDNAQYIADRSGNTPNGYRTLLNDIGAEDATDDNWDIFNGSVIAPFPPFDNTNFVIINPPTLHFTASAASVAEDAGTATLTVELAESNSSAVSVDVAFLSGSSTASASDIGSYTTQTVSFMAGDGDGATRTVTVSLTDDSNFEGNENAVFRLQNPSPGSVVAPEVLTLTVSDDDAPDIVFNEIDSDPEPNDDSNNDGIVDDNSDEFIEFVNNETRDIDISGWTYADDNSDRYTFPEGATIGARSAIVLFDNDGGSAFPKGGFGGAVVYSDGELGLNNSPETLTLKDANGIVVETARYDNNASGESNNLSSDRTGASYVNHSTLSGGSLSSPGTKVDGTAFGSTYAIGLRGTEGYRFVATPTVSTSFDDLFSNLWTQGATGSDAPTGATANIYSWNETGGGTFAAVTDMSATVTPGQGYIIYVYEDDDFRAPGVQGGFPKVINTNNAENGSPVSVAVSSNDDNTSGGIDGNEGFNLLGNPYGTDISAAAVINALEAVNPNVNTNLSIWDHEAGGGNGQYITLDGSGSSSDVIAPFQAFFVRYTVDGVSGNASFDRNDLAANSGAEFYGQPNETDAIVQFQIDMGDGQKFDSYNVAFREKGTIGEDRYDAYKLFSLNPNSINFFSTVGDGVKLAKNVLPSLDELDGEGELRVPLKYDIPKSGTYTFSWSDLEDLPNDLELYMLDNETGEKVNLKTQEQFQVTLGQGSEQTTVEKVANNRQPNPVLGSKNSSNNESSTRFELLVTYDTSQQVPQKDPITQPIVISPNYPNPFNSQTTMDVQVREKMRVKMTIYNIVGQQVATMADKVMNPGQEYPMTWNVPANMPSGIYICKVEAGGKVVTRKMTLVK